MMTATSWAATNFTVKTGHNCLSQHMQQILKIHAYLVPEAQQEKAGVSTMISFFSSSGEQPQSSVWSLFCRYWGPAVCPQKKAGKKKKKLVLLPNSWPISVECRLLLPKVAAHSALLCFLGGMRTVRSGCGAVFAQIVGLHLVTAGLGVVGVYSRSDQHGLCCPTLITSDLIFWEK